MNRRTVLRRRLRADVHALAALLRRPDADPREVWRLADAVLDAHDAAGDELHSLRAEVVWLMRQVAARRPVDADACAARLRDAAGSIPADTAAARGVALCG